MAASTPVAQFMRNFFHIPPALPRWLRHAFLGDPSSRQLTFSENADAITVRRHTVTAPQDLLAPGVCSKTLKRSVVVDVHLPKSRFLARKINAPRQLRQKELVDFAELDLRQRTPFGVNDVVWALSFGEKADGKRFLTQWVIRKADLDGLRQRLISNGLVPRRFFVAGANTLAPIADYTRSIAPHARTWRRVNFALFLVAALSSVATWVLPGFSTRRDLAERNTQLASVRSDTVALRQELDLLRHAESERARFVDAVLHHKRLIAVLHDLTVVLPETTWLSALTYTEKNVTVSGEVKGSAAELVLLLADHPEFVKAQLHRTARR